jgi:carboxymethylenebutenolidase
MRKSFLVVAALLVLSLPASAQDWAKERLQKSPRHMETVLVKAGPRTVQSFLVFPEVPDKATAIVVIHENMGLTDWARSVADQLAEAGYIAIAPDLLSGMAPNGGGTADFTDRNGISQAFARLTTEQVLADLNAVADHVSKLPAANGKVAVAGFCWGGGQAFAFATSRPTLAAAFVFYGTPPEDPAAIARIAAPVYGFYGGNDARVNATIPQTQERMKAAGKVYEPVIYAGAGHGFMRGGEDPAGTAVNKKARDDAWQRLKTLLAKL